MPGSLRIAERDYEFEPFCCCCLRLRLFFFLFFSFVISLFRLVLIVTTTRRCVNLQEEIGDSLKKLFFFYGLFAQVGLSILL